MIGSIIYFMYVNVCYANLIPQKSIYKKTAYLVFSMIIFLVNESILIRCRRKENNRQMKQRFKILKPPPKARATPETGHLFFHVAEDLVKINYTWGNMYTRSVCVYVCIWNGRKDRETKSN